MLVTGLVVVYGYMCELFFGWYSANKYEGFMIWNRMTGPYWYMYWTLIFCNGLVPQLLWIKKIRLNVAILFVISIIVNIGKVQEMPRSCGCWLALSDGAGGGHEGAGPAVLRLGPDAGRGGYL